MKRRSLVGALTLVCFVLAPLMYSHFYADAQVGGQRAASGEGQETAADTAQLKDALNKASLRLKTGKEDLKTVYVRQPGGQKSVLSGVYADEVLRNIESGKETLLSSLARPNLEGVKAHVEEFYPKPNLTFVALAPQSTASTAQMRILVSEESADNAFSEVKTYIDKVAAATARPTVNLRVNSSETPAYCKIWAATGQPRDVTTNDVTENLYRGYYTYTVTKTDYKKIEGRLNLIDEDGSVLDCTMYKTSDKEGPYPCKLK